MLDFYRLMQLMLVSLFAINVALASCGGAPEPATVVTTLPAPTATTFAEYIEAVQAAEARLANEQGVPVPDIRVVAVTPKDWSNACLGISQPDVMCAEVITPGYEVVLETKGQVFVFRTDSNGAVVMPAPAP